MLVFALLCSSGLIMHGGVYLCPHAGAVVKTQQKPWIPIAAIILS